MRYHLFVLISVVGILFVSAPVSPSRAVILSAPIKSKVSAHIQPVQPALMLVAPSQAQPLNGFVEVEVAIKGVSNLAAFEFELVFDRSRVRVRGITLGKFLGKTRGCNCNTDRCVRTLGPTDLANGIKVGAFSFGYGAGANGDNVLAVLHLQSTGVEGVFPLQLANARLTDVAGNSTIPVTQGTTITFGSTALSAPPETAVPTLPSANPELIKENITYLPLIFKQQNTPSDLAINNTTVSSGGNIIYLPLIFKYQDTRPDLIIDQIVATSSSITMTISNQGYSQVNDGFWIDVYFFEAKCPIVVPSVNRPWDTIAKAGIVFAVESVRAWPLNLPINPGESRVLTLTHAYVGEYGSSPPPYPVGVYVYALIDSVDFNTKHGAVLENDEENNLYGPTTATTGVAPLTELTSLSGLKPGNDLPPRKLTVGSETQQ